MGSFNEPWRDYFKNSNSELVIGIVQTVGTDSQPVLSYIKDALRPFGYKTETIKVSEMIISSFDTQDKQFENEYDRITYYMDLGNKVREMTNDGAVLMEGVTAYIYSEHHKDEYKPQRIAYIIDSLKHTDEVDFLRGVYGEGFHLIGISETEENRKNYLHNQKNISVAQAGKLIARDSNESNKNGQHARDTFEQADYFIDAGRDKLYLEASVKRLFELIFGNPFISPQFEEYAMFRAYAASLRSADLSRQIGAVIARGEDILAEGVNDCTKAFGGLYWPYYNEDTHKIEDEPNGRDYTLGYDSNKKEQSQLIRNILDNFEMDYNEENIRKIKSAGIGSLTEYGRVVHSEMEALMMCARNGIVTRNCDMYVTTFPCHNCAKHIIDAGIRSVIYIEPYPKSKALDFYNNEITTDEKDNTKVLFRPFNGVGPHRFMDLFSMKSTRWYKRVRKGSDGNAIPWDAKKASVRNPMRISNYRELESLSYSRYYNILKSLENMEEEQ